MQLNSTLQKLIAPWNAFILLNDLIPAAPPHPFLLCCSTSGSPEGSGRGLFRVSIIEVQMFIKIQRLKGLYSSTSLKQVCWLHTNHVTSQVEQHTFSKSWYFMILWTGLMSRSLSCSLWPNCCLRSCQETSYRKSVFESKKRERGLLKFPLKTI